MITRLACPTSRSAKHFVVQTSPTLVKYAVPSSRRSVTTAVDVAATLASGPAFLMTSLHQCGLPWWAVFPTTAAVIRTAVVLPLLQVPLRQALQRRAMLTPLINASVHLALRQSRRTAAYTSPLIRRLVTARLASKQAAKIGSQYGAVPRPILTRLASFVVLLVVSEAIRRLCGNEAGLLTLIMDPIFEFFGLEAVKDAPTDHAIPADDQGDSRASSQSDLVISQTSTDVWYQPTVKTEGIPYWCPDLSAPDSTLVLPAMFSASFAASVYFAPRSADGNSPETSDPTPSADNTSASPVRQSRLTNMQRTGMSLAVLLFFPALKMPSGLLLYLISNTGVNALHTRYLARKIPLRLGPRACKNPISTYTINDRFKG